GLHVARLDPLQIAVHGPREDRVLARHPDGPRVTAVELDPVDVACMAPRHRPQHLSEPAPMGEHLVTGFDVLDRCRPAASDNLLAWQQAPRLVMVTLEVRVARELHQVAVALRRLRQRGQVVVELLAPVAFTTRVVEAPATRRPLVAAL